MFLEMNKRIRNLNNRPDFNKGMINLYDQVRKILITPRVVDMDYVPTYDK